MLSTKVQFHNPDLQRTVDRLEARRKSPEAIALRQADLREARREYWTSLPFAVVLTVAVIPAVLLAVMHLVFGMAIGPLQWSLLVGMPALVFGVTFPR